MARVLDAIRSHRAKRLSCVEAGDLLGLSERHFRRLRFIYVADALCYHRDQSGPGLVSGLFHLGIAG